jgi:hypothetical protein
MQRTFSCYACRTTRFIGAVVSTLTSRRAVRLYRAIFRYTVLSLQIAAAILLILGAAIFFLGWLTHYGVTRHNRAVDTLVDRCLVPPVQVQLTLPGITPIALLPAARLEAEAEVDPWDLPHSFADTATVAPLTVLITPPPVPTPQLLLAPASEAPKRKPGRPRKAKATKPTTEMPKRKPGRPRKEAVA